ncbi:unnamed protein product [Microthlaspi erraticum]|uniref:Uncharacterized protein n=1 Tax=Microthlaspi erraticum TaxID=1685480 RepID=A0A6D2HKW4_9BRAS|nr:unnamed protein product [Microthlaspi erraticum]
MTHNDLILHFNSFHSSHVHHFSTLSSSAAAAPTTFRYYPNLNRNPNPAFPVNYYRSGYIDEEGRFHKRSPTIAPARKTNSSSGQQQKPKLMDLFPEKSSESVQTLPLLRQLEQRRSVDTVTRNSGAISSSIDLTLRL